MVVGGVVWGWGCAFPPRVSPIFPGGPDGLERSVSPLPALPRAHNMGCSPRRCPSPPTRPQSPAFLRRYSLAPGGTSESPQACRGPAKSSDSDFILRVTRTVYLLLPQEVSGRPPRAACAQAQLPALCSRPAWSGPVLGAWMLCSRQGEWPYLILT